MELFKVTSAACERLFNERVTILRAVPKDKWPCSAVRVTYVHYGYLVYGNASCVYKVFG